MIYRSQVHSNKRHGRANHHRAECLANWPGVRYPPSQLVRPGEAGAGPRRRRGRRKLHNAGADTWIGCHQDKRGALASLASMGSSNLSPCTTRPTQVAPIFPVPICRPALLGICCFACGFSTFAGAQTYKLIFDENNKFFTFLRPPPVGLAGAHCVSGKPPIEMRATPMALEADEKIISEQNVIRRPTSRF